MKGALSKGNKTFHMLRFCSLIAETKHINYKLFKKNTIFLHVCVCVYVNCGKHLRIRIMIKDTTLFRFYSVIY